MAEPAAAIRGVGYTALSDDSGKSVLSLAREACAAAIADAGLEHSEVDGVASFMLNDDSVPCLAVATALGLGDVRLVLDLSLGGQAPCHLVNLAAQAVRTEQARHVVVFRAMNGRSGARVGAMHFPGLGGSYRYPIGYEAYLMYIAMWARRYLHETGHVLGAEHGNVSETLALHRCKVEGQTLIGLEGPSRMSSVRGTKTWCFAYTDPQGGPKKNLTLVAEFLAENLR